MHSWRIVCASLFLFVSVGYAQVTTAPPNSFSGIASSQASNPISPTITQYGCSTGSTTWAYMITANDAGVGSTAGTPVQLMNSSCSSLSPTQFNLLSFAEPIGAITCSIYRTSPSPSGTIGLVATIPCGGGLTTQYQDIGTTVTANAVPPTINSTGSLNASGTVTGLNFLSMGISAGTSDWVQGSPLPLCATGQAQPCIQPSSFFLQAPQGAITSFGWTAPITANAAGSAPLVVGQSSSSGVPTSTLSYGFPGVTGTVIVGDLATYTSSSGTIGNCTTLPCSSIIGVFNYYNPSSVPAIPPTWISSGETLVNLDVSAPINVNAGDILCASATMGNNILD